MNEFDAKARTWDTDEKRQRAETVAAMIRTEVPLHKEMRALEYGCGTGLLSFALRPYLGSITLVDSSEGMLAVVDEKITAAEETAMAVRKLDLAVDPLPRERFDIIYTLLALHHIADVESVLANLVSLLAPGGRLCIADLDTEDGSFHGEGFTGHHGFDRGELSRQLAGLGLVDIAVRDCFSMSRAGADGERRFSVFLLIGSRG